MTYDFDTIINRHHTNSEKYDGVKKFAPDTPDNNIPLWIADMDFRTAPEIISAMRERVEEGIFGYTDIYDAAYYEAVCGWMKRRHGWDVNPEDIILDSGVVPSLSHALKLIADPGDGVIIHTPTYKPFFNSIRDSDMIPVFSELRYMNGSYEIDFGDFEEKAGHAANKVFILCSPHNPTGRVWTRPELSRMMDICRRHGVFVICDEIHSDIVRPGIQHVPLASLYPEEHRLITCTAPSKTFNLAGNHLANIIIPDRELREQWNSRYHYLPNPISVAAVISAYNQGEAWADSLNAYLSGTFKMMKEYIDMNLPHIGFEIPEATYLAWIHIKSPAVPHQEMVDRFIRNGLIIEGGDQFISNGTDFIRMNVAMPRSIIEHVLEKTKYIFNP